MWITFGQIDNSENCSNDVKRTIRRYSILLYILLKFSPFPFTADPS